MQSVVVINGSPKGKKSITLKFAEYLQKKHPQTRFRIFHVAQEIRSYAQGPEQWTELLEALRGCQGVIWTFPVYVFMAPASLLRFIELIDDFSLQDAFRGHYTCSISSSIHFYDNLAQDQLRGALEDLGMHYTEGFTADQEDFFKPSFRRAVEVFYADFCACWQEGRTLPRKFAPLSASALHYTPGPVAHPLPLEGRKIAVVADLSAPGSNIGPMVERFAAAFDGPVDIIDLNRLNIRGACTGCMKCALDHQCTYGDKDQLKAVYEQRIDPADILVYAGSLRKRYFSALMKLLVERRFMRTHYPFTKDKQVALLVAGPLEQCATLYQTFEADAQVNEAHFAGAVSDQWPDSAALDAALDGLAARVLHFSKESYLPPDSFLGVAGRKMFRDEVWGRYRYVFQADHRYYRQRGFYDFPQKDWRMRLRNFFLMLRLQVPRTRRQMRNTMPGFMVKPFIDELEKM